MFFSPLFYVRTHAQRPFMSQVIDKCLLPLLLRLRPIASMYWQQYREIVTIICMPSRLLYGAAYTLPCPYRPPLKSIQHKFSYLQCLCFWSGQSNLQKEQIALKHGTWSVLTKKIPNKMKNRLLCALKRKSLENPTDHFYEVIKRLEFNAEIFWAI